MAIETIEKKIGKTRYALTALSGSKGLKSLTKLMGLVGDPLAKSDESDAFAAAVGRILSRLDSDDARELIRELLGSLHVGGPQGGYVAVDFDEHFSRNYGELIDVVRWALELNFSSFLDGSDSVKQIREVLQSTDSPPLQNQKQSSVAGLTGLSGAQS